MGSLYQRPGSKFWWIAYLTATGKRKQQSSGEVDEEKARALLKAIERKVERERVATGGKGPLTFRRFVEEVWMPARRARGLRSLKKDTLWLSKAYPHIGDEPLAEITAADITAMNDAVRQLALAPRSMNHVYKAVKLVFEAAMKRGHCTATPCVHSSRDGDLPKNVDADPTWRRTAIFTRAEAEQLISDATVPPLRRLLFGMQVLGGMRIGEAVVRRWRDYDAEARPLGMLAIDTHWGVEAKVILPGTKAGPAREMPVHPTLAAMLADWKLHGWPERHGRPPEPSDFIVAAEGDAARMLSPNGCWNAQSRLLTRLGMRPRRQHDFRATLITLAQADGAPPHILKWVTHGSPGGIISEYTRLPWASLCAEVAKLRLKPRGAKAVRLRAVAT